MSEYGTCKRKAPHYSPVRATLACYALEERRPGEEFEPYRCKYCGFWHIGHKRGPRVLFQFDERSIFSVEGLERRGFNFTKIQVGSRELLIPHSVKAWSR